MGARHNLTDCIGSYLGYRGNDKLSGWDKTWNPDTHDLRTVFAHEYGHDIGIGHSTSGGAVMHSSIGALERIVSASWVARMS